jgi:S-formylglutathione hydrolase FrmB
MKAPWHRRTSSLFLLAIALLFVSCRGDKQEAPPPDRPQLTAAVKMVDVKFHSASLNRDMPYRVVMPVNIAAAQKLPVVYLLHGGGGSFHDWSNYSDVARYAERGLILVMPEGNYSYYMNSVERPKDRYEDYIVHDLIADVEQRFPALTGRANRAIAGMSMGGFGAVVLALKHPDLYVFAGGLSSALDARPFSIRRIGQWRDYRAIFGPWKSKGRHDNDPYTLARSADPTQTPYLFLTCGEQEGLLGPNKEFANILKQRHFSYEFHIAPGGHDWNQWDRRIPDLFASLMQHISKN